MTQLPFSPANPNQVVSRNPSPVRGSGPLTDISIANTGSGSTLNVVPNDPLRAYLFVHNPNSNNIGLNPTNGTASVGAAGTITILSGGQMVWETLFVPTCAMSVCGTSGNAVTIITG